MTIYGKGCISNYRNCSLSYVWYSVLYRMLTLFCWYSFLLQTVEVVEDAVYGVFRTSNDEA